LRLRLGSKSRPSTAPESQSGIDLALGKVKAKSAGDQRRADQKQKAECEDLDWIDDLATLAANARGRYALPSIDTRAWQMMGLLKGGKLQFARKNAIAVRSTHEIKIRTSRGNSETGDIFRTNVYYCAVLGNRRRYRLYPRILFGTVYWYSSRGSGTI
jgi:hypothetical protein